MPTVLDTGASITILDAELANILDIKPDKKLGLRTATAAGIITLSTGILPKIIIGNMAISDTPIAISNLPKELEVRCVLGMNVLREFLVEIDSLNKNITLTKQPLPKKFYKEGYSISMLNDGFDDAREA